MCHVSCQDLTPDTVCEKSLSNKRVEASVIGPVAF